MEHNFGVMDKVATWTNDLEALRTIKGQRYQMLLDIYLVEELDQVDDWIEKIAIGYKVMIGLDEDIQEMKAKALE